MKPERCVKVTRIAGVSADEPEVILFESGAEAPQKEVGSQKSAVGGGADFQVCCVADFQVG